MNIPLAPFSAVVVGLLAAAGLAALPVPALEALVLDSGIPALIPAAAPPLGGTARLLVSAGVGVLAAIFAWFGMFILLGTRSVDVGTGESDEADAAEPVPSVRRADAHPDAPPRPPLRATRDLGTPFLEVRARLRKGDAVADVPPDEDEPFTLTVPAPKPLDAVPTAQPPIDLTQLVAAPEPVAPPPSRRGFAPESPPELMPEPMAPPAVAKRRRRPVPAEAPMPRNLEQRLSSYDPGAIPDEPLEPPRRLASLRRVPAPPIHDAGERFETFELTPPVRTRSRTDRVADSGRAEEAIAHPQTDETIHALLDRLERGVERRGLGMRASPAPCQPSDHGLEDALVTLRNLARRA